MNLQMKIHDGRMIVNDSFRVQGHVKCLLSPIQTHMKKIYADYRAPEVLWWSC